MYATYTIWHKHMTKFLRNAEEAIGIMLQPILWVTLFGIGMGRLVGGATGGDYLSFMVPGIVALSALGGAVAGGMSLLDERLRGIIKEYMVAPIPRLSILMGNAASTATKALLQALVIVLVGALMGTRFSPNPAGWLLGLALLALYALGFAGLALAVAAQSRSFAGYHGMIFLFNLPLLFASNALYPLASMPPWMAGIAMANPTTYLIDTLRTLVFAAPATIPVALSTLVLALFAAAGMALALVSFRRAVA